MNHSNTSTSIMTATGRYFDYLDLDSYYWDIEDIAHPLSGMLRFTCHSRQPYTVAQHSVLVSVILALSGKSKPVQFQGLMHDAAEAVMGDVNSPLKKLLPDFKAIEKRVEHSVFRAFGLPEEFDPAVKVADMQALSYEKKHVMNAQGHAWRSDSFVYPEALEDIPFKTWSRKKAKRLFMQAYYDLRYAK